jgi:DNA-binding GntR family transcriptional regulator
MVYIFIYKIIYNNSKYQQEIFESLKIDIMRGAYKPREHLVERELAKRYGVSRTPIREAIRKLDVLGLVNIIDNQGATVKDFSRQDIDNLFYVRLILEREAAKLACSYVTAADIEFLANINEKLLRAKSSDDFSLMVENDQDFHLTLCRYSRNPILVKMIEDLRIKSYPVSYFFWKTSRELQKSLSEHREIINALKNRDKAKLRSLITKNLNKSRLRYVKFSLSI